MNPKVDAFLQKAEKWQAESAKLRAILLGCPLTEELKWGQPCYTFQGKNIVLIGSFKEYCVLLFFKGALLTDANKILIRPGEHMQAGRQIRFTSLQQIAAMEATVKACIHEAIEVEKAGLKVKLKAHSEYELPEELQNKFVENPDLKTAFYALTPGRQRAYILHFSAPKQSKTRASRIEKSMPLIFSGKGFNDRMGTRLSGNAARAER